PISLDKGSQKTEKPYAIPIQRWIARAAGGTSQRLNPGPAMVRSLFKKDNAAMWRFLSGIKSCVKVYLGACILCYCTPNEKKRKENGALSDNLTADLQLDIIEHRQAGCLKWYQHKLALEKSKARRLKALKLRNQLQTDRTCRLQPLFPGDPGRQDDGG
ncbi:MAG: hypothetical protein AAGU25_09185, partial [bacterium]